MWENLEIEMACEIYFYLHSSYKHRKEKCNHKLALLDISYIFSRGCIKQNSEQMEYASNMISPTFLVYTSQQNSFGLLFIKIAVGPYPTVRLKNIYEFTPLKEDPLPQPGDMHVEFKKSSVHNKAKKPKIQFILFVSCRKTSRNYAKRY